METSLTLSVAPPDRSPEISRFAAQIARRHDAAATLQRRAAVSSPDGPRPDGDPNALQAALRRQGGPGAAPDSAVRRRLSGALGFDPAEARLHDDPAAAQAARTLQAEAFTIGRDVFFGAGKFDPASPQGLGLIAHELTHVGQQTGTTEVQTRLRAPGEGDAMEREAQAVASLVLARAPLRLEVAHFACEYAVPEGDAALTRDQRGTLDALSQAALRRAAQQLEEAGPVAGGTIEALDVPVFLDWETLDESVGAQVWADAIVDAVLARQAAGTGLRASVSVQRKMSVGASDDASEREADRAAAQVTGRAPRVQAAGGDGGGDLSPELEADIGQARTGGASLPGDVRRWMEQAFGADFGGVRVHADAQADALSRQLSADAFTTGRDIFFRRGLYAPDDAPGRELLAHELTHVVQQAPQVIRRVFAVQVGLSGDGALVEYVHLGDRPKNLFGSAMGSHSTAWGVIEAGVKLAVIGKTIPNAVKEVTRLYDAAKVLPGIMAVKKNRLDTDLRQHLTDAENEITPLCADAVKTATPSTHEFLQKYIRAYMQYRHVVPLSTASLGTARGSGEAWSFTELNRGEKALQGGPVVYTDEQRSLMRVAFWSLLDAAALLKMEDSDLGKKRLMGAEQFTKSFPTLAAHMIRQHLATVKAAYPLIFAVSQVNAEVSLEAFLEKHGFPDAADITRRIKRQSVGALTTATPVISDRERNKGPVAVEADDEDEEIDEDGEEDDTGVSAQELKAKKQEAKEEARNPNNTFAVEVGLTAGAVTKLLIGKRPDNLFTGGMGDHTSAWGLVEVSVRAAVMNESLADAITGLTTLCTDTKKLPGVSLVGLQIMPEEPEDEVMPVAGAEVVEKMAVEPTYRLNRVHRARFEKGEEEMDALTAVAGNVANQTADFLQKYIRAYMEYRHAVPLSAAKFGVASGKAEAKRLEELRGMNGRTVFTDLEGSRMRRAMWDLLDYRTLDQIGANLAMMDLSGEEPEAEGDGERAELMGAALYTDPAEAMAEIIWQHLMTLKSAYPDLYDHSKINSKVAVAAFLKRTDLSSADRVFAALEGHLTDETPTLGDFDRGGHLVKKMTAAHMEEDAWEDEGEDDYASDEEEERPKRKRAVSTSKKKKAKKDFKGPPGFVPVQTAVAGAPASGGRGMPDNVQVKMEQAFGVDFSGVRIHEGSHVSRLGAFAYAEGTHLHFAPGAFRPDTRAGQELIGHELAHVVQQSRGRVEGAGVNDDAVLEREADERGRRAALGQNAADHVGAVMAQSGPAHVRQLMKFLYRSSWPSLGGWKIYEKAEKDRTPAETELLTLETDVGKLLTTLEGLLADPVDRRLVAWKAEFATIKLLEITDANAAQIAAAKKRLETLETEVKAQIKTENERRTEDARLDKIGVKADAAQKTIEQWGKDYAAAVSRSLETIKPFVALKAVIDAFLVDSKTWPVNRTNKNWGPRREAQIKAVHDAGAIHVFCAESLRNYDEEKARREEATKKRLADETERLRLAEEAAKIQRPKDALSKAAFFRDLRTKGDGPTIVKMPAVEALRKSLQPAYDALIADPSQANADTFTKAAEAYEQAFKDGQALVTAHKKALDEFKEAQKLTAEQAARCTAALPQVADPVGPALTYATPADLTRFADARRDLPLLKAEFERQSAALTPRVTALEHLPLPTPESNTDAEAALTAHKLDNTRRAVELKRIEAHAKAFTPTDAVGESAKDLQNL